MTYCFNVLRFKFFAPRGCFQWFGLNITKNPPHTYLHAIEIHFYSLPPTFKVSFRSKLQFKTYDISLIEINRK